MINPQIQGTINEIEGSFKSANFSDYIFIQIADSIFIPSDCPDQIENEIHFESETSDIAEFRESKLTATEILEKVFEVTGRKPIMKKLPSEIFKEDRLLED